MDFQKIMASSGTKKTYGALDVFKTPGGAEVITLQDEEGNITSPSFSVTRKPSGEVFEPSGPKTRSTAAKALEDIKDAVKAGKVTDVKTLATDLFWSDQEGQVPPAKMQQLNSLVAQAQEQHEKIKSLTVSLPKYEKILKNPDGSGPAKLQKARLALQPTKPATDEDVRKAKAADPDSTLKVGDLIPNNPSAAQKKAAEDLIWAAEYWGITDPVGTTIPGWTGRQ